MQFYLNWAQHEPKQGDFHFDGVPTPNDFPTLLGSANISEWVQLAQSLGLNVIARIGPYMDAEQDMGGLPAWLLKNRWGRNTIPSRHAQGYSPAHQRPSLYHGRAKLYERIIAGHQTTALSKRRAGGRQDLTQCKSFSIQIVMVQVENEYGSYYACDRNYTKWLLANVRKQLNTEDIVYFTVDGNSVRF
jgi:beta-galactosidase